MLWIFFVVHWIWEINFYTIVGFCRFKMSNFVGKYIIYSCTADNDYIVHELPPPSIPSSSTSKMTFAVFLTSWIVIIQCLSHPLQVQKCVSSNSMRRYANGVRFLAFSFSIWNTNLFFLNSQRRRLWQSQIDAVEKYIFKHFMEVSGFKTSRLYWSQWC